MQRKSYCHWDLSNQFNFCQLQSYDLKKDTAHNFVPIKTLSTSNMLGFWSSPRVLDFRFGGKLEKWESTRPVGKEAVTEGLLKRDDFLGLQFLAGDMLGWRWWPRQGLAQTREGSRLKYSNHISLDSQHTYLTGCKVCLLASQFGIVWEQYIFLPQHCMATRMTRLGPYTVSLQYYHGGPSVAGIIHSRQRRDWAQKDWQGFTSFTEANRELFLSVLWKLHQLIKTVFQLFLNGEKQWK